MTTDRPTDSLIDLLYGELSEEDEELVREELAESAELRAEFEGYEELLADVREAMPVEDVSPSVHASIMEAARAAVENPDAGAVRRPAAGEPEKQGIWRRLTGGQGSQIALVAAVLLAGVFVVKFINPNTGGAPMSDVSQVQEAAPAVAAKAEVSAEEEESDAPGSATETLDDESRAEGTFAEAEPAEEPAPDIWGNARGDGSAAADGEAPEAPARETRSAAAAEDQRLQQAKPAPKPRPRPKKRSRRSAKDAPVEQKPTAKSADKLDSLLDTDAFGGESTKTKSGPSGRVQEEKSESSYGAVPEEEAAAEPAPSAAAPNDDAYRAEANSLAAVTQRWRANDYNGTIRAADEFLETDSGSRTERARALQLKAQSLARLGQYSQADRIYRSIQANYPGYQANEINRARDEIQQKLRKRPARKKKAAPRPANERDEIMLDSLD